MPRERDPPYVAAGFRNDAQKLLDRFVAKQSLRFVDFAEIWCDLKFSTIFMGREGLRELTEFVEECYRNTLLFMDASNPYRKVGAVYLLYSLYMKQPRLLLKTQISIKVSYKQVWDIYNLENHFLDVATDNDSVLDLTYIVTKLFKMEAFCISCFPIPMGPAVPIPLLRLEPLRNSFFKEMLGVLRMHNESDVKNICDLSKRHEDLKKQLPFLCSSVSKAAGGLDKFEEMKELIDELEDRYNAGLFPNKHVSGDVKIDEEFRTLGQRRALLKSQQFERVAEFRKSKVRTSADSSESGSSAPVKKGRGRPKKKKKRKTGKRGRNKKDDVVNTECRVENEREYIQVETEADDPQTEAEIVDNPETPQSVPFFPFRRPSKYPRPIRKHYFQNNEDEDEDGC